MKPKAKETPANWYTTLCLRFFLSEPVITHQITSTIKHALKKYITATLKPPYCQKPGRRAFTDSHLSG